VAAIFTSFYAPDVVWESVGLGTTFRGLAAARGFVTDWVGRFEDYEIDVEAIVDLGGGVTFVRSGHTGRLVGSPRDVLLPREVLVHVLVWENAMVTRVISSGDTPEARALAERIAEES